MEPNNLFAALQAAWAADWDAAAIETAGGAVYRWGDIERGSAMLANALESLGLPSGSRLLAQVDKSVEALLVYLATVRAGWVYVPLNIAYTQAELQHFLADAAPAVAVCASRNFPWLSRLAYQHGVRNVFTLDADRRGSLLDRAAQFDDQHALADVAPDALALILYTSGTTGRSKGAMLTHANLLSNARSLQLAWDVSRDDVLVHALPIFHVHGLLVAAQLMLLSGARLLWLDAFEPRAVLAQLPRANLFMGVPTMYVRLLQEPALTHECCAGMRLFVSGSAPLRLDTFAQWQQRTGHTILERYGMSETGMLTSNPCRAEDGARRGGTVGRALPDVQVRVVGDDGVPVPADTPGGVEVRGPNVAAGYWQLPQQTQQAFAIDGAGLRWFKTGDRGRLDGDGVLTLVGRSKDLVITGGFNVDPAEVEARLDAFAGVLESAVIGVPHPDFGEAVVAVVVAQPGRVLDADELLAQLRPVLAGFKCPKRLLFAEALPCNAMGKVQKALLRQAHAALFAAPATDATG